MKNPTLPPQLHSWSNYCFHYLMAVMYVCNISVAGQYENGICIVWPERRNKKSSWLLAFLWYITIIFNPLQLTYRDLKKKILFFERVVTFCQFRPLKPFSRSKKGCKGALSHEKSREGPKSFSSCPVSLEHFYGWSFMTDVKNSCL